jgi:hypothetical protein
MHKEEQSDLENESEPKVETRSIKRAKFSKRLLDHLINGVIVFSSVFLAFWLSDYRQEQLQRQVSDQVLLSVKEEIRTNKKILERWAPEHKQMIARAEDFLTHGIDTAHGFNLGIITNGRPIMQELLTTSSWENLNQSNLMIDMNDRILINRIYRQQLYVENAISKIADDFFNQRELLDATKARDNYIIFYRLISDLYGQEMAMITEYELALSVLKN